MSQSDDERSTHPESGSSGSIWGLTDISFYTTPPEDPTELSRLFMAVSASWTWRYRFFMRGATCWCAGCGVLATTLLNALEPRARLAFELAPALLSTALVAWRPTRVRPLVVLRSE